LHCRYLTRPHAVPLQWTQRGGLSMPKIKMADEGSNNDKSNK
jgi:hypothetical protein